MKGVTTWIAEAVMGNGGMPFDADDERHRAGLPEPDDSHLDNLVDLVSEKTELAD